MVNSFNLSAEEVAIIQVRMFRLAQINADIRTASYRCGFAFNSAAPGRPVPIFSWSAQYHQYSLFVVIMVQPIPSTELGPAAQDVCRDGFSYEAIPNTTCTTSTTSVAEPVGKDSSAAATSVSVGQKRSVNDISSDAAVTSADQEEAVEEAVVPVSFGNDSKRVGGSRGPNKTGRTDAERAHVRAYLRQGVDRYVAGCVGKFSLPVFFLGLFAVHRVAPYPRLIY
jgi:hypothetical protein